MQTFSFKNSVDVAKHVCIVHVPNEKNDMTSCCLDRKQIPCATWRAHSTGTGQPLETQDVFFWHLAGRSAPTELAIIHWIGCINAIKLLCSCDDMCTPDPAVNCSVRQIFKSGVWASRLSVPPIPERCKHGLYFICRGCQGAVGVITGQMCAKGSDWL